MGLLCGLLLIGGLGAILIGIIGMVAALLTGDLHNGIMSGLICVAGLVAGTAPHLASNKRRTLMSPKEIQDAVQAELPPGFFVMNFGQSFIAGKDVELFAGQFRYCDRYKYFSIKVPPEPSVQEICDLILMTPVLDDCPEGHYHAVARCWQQNHP